MKYYDWMETEMILRLMQREYTVIDLGKLINYDFYHLEHYSPRVPWATFTNRKANPGFDLKNPPKLDFHPNSDNWGLFKYPLEIVSDSPGLADAETKTLASPLFKWPAFFILLASAGTQMAYDTLVIQKSRFVRRWKLRARVVSEAVRGQPVLRWPAVLKSLWVERNSRLRQREEY
jgi:hypothetical protein